MFSGKFSNNFISYVMFRFSFCIAAKTTSSATLKFKIWPLEDLTCAKHWFAFAITTLFVTAKPLFKNETAVKMGLKSTHFVNPHGLHDDEHYTSAYDLAYITCEGLKNEDFAKICSTKIYKFQLQTGENKCYVAASFPDCNIKP